MHHGIASEPTWEAVKFKTFLGEQSPDPLNASALCTEVRTNVHSVPMLCPSIDVVLAMPLKPTPEIECIYNTFFFME